MKQLSALGARRHAFFRGPRRMRALGGRLEDPDILGPAAYGYYGGQYRFLSKKNQTLSDPSALEAPCRRTQKNKNGLFLIYF